MRETVPKVSRGRQRSLRETLTALVLGACLVVAWAGDATGAHSCPHHDAVPGTADAGDASGSGHGAHHASPAGEHRSGARHEHHGPCTCVGTCHASAAAPVPATAAAQLVNVGSPSQSRPIPERDGFRVVTLPYVLPYANAPPTAS